MNEQASPLRQGEETQEVMKAYANIEGEGIQGQAEFVEILEGTQRYVEITVKVAGNPKILKPGLHAVHIHEKGVCEPPFKSAMGHFDPGPAGDSDPDVNHPYHMGDLPNIFIGRDGTGTLKTISTRITLSPGPLSILTDEGTSLMIHANEDPYLPGPHGSGISGGPRIACGEIRKAG